jgi:hypothetical protein
VEDGAAEHPRQDGHAAPVERVRGPLQRERVDHRAHEAAQR